MPDTESVYTELMHHQRTSTLTDACTCGAGDAGALLDTGQALQAHYRHIATVLAPLLPEAPANHDDAATTTQYGVQVVWSDPAAAGVTDPDEADNPRWAIFDNADKAEGFASSYREKLDAGPHNNIAAVNCATRWAKQSYGPWEPTREDRARR